MTNTLHGTVTTLQNSTPKHL